VRIQGVALEDHRQPTPRRRHVIDPLPVDPELAGGDLLQAGDHAEQGGLAASGRADEDAELAVVDLEVDPLEDLDVAVALADLVS
jgi:hypothetical protein